MSPAAESAPLAHLRVLDLCDLRGALAGRLLADLGAEVLRIEPPGGDPDRLRAPFAGNRRAPDRSLAFLYRNAGKRQTVLDVGDAGGRRRLGRLLARADVLLENLAPERRAALGLEPAELQERHRHLIHAAIGDFGLSGPRAGWRLEPLAAFAASGALFASGFADRPPCWIPGYLAHDCAAAFAVAGVLAALLDRARHGRGQTVEVSVQEAALCGLHPWSIPLVDYARAYPVLPSSPGRDADGAYLVLPTARGYVRVLPGTPRQLAGFLRLLFGAQPSSPGDEPAPGTSRRSGAPDRAASGPLARLAAQIRDLAPERIAHRLEELPHEALRRASAAVTAAASLAPFPGLTNAALRASIALGRRLAALALRARSRDEVLATAARLRVPMAPVQTPDEFVGSAQARARAFFVAAGFPRLERAPFASLPFRFSGAAIAPARPAPPPQESVAGFRRRAGAPSASPTADTPAGGRATDAAPASPCAGLRVINLGVGAAVPELGWMLAELGAEVIRIESSANLDFLRRITVELEQPNRSWMFNDANRGQQSVCLDLGTERGRALARRLCESADVVIENNRGGVVEAWGLDHRALRAARPELIYLSSQGYGRGGPLGDAPSFGPLVSAFAGITWIANHSDAPYPAGSSLNHPDHVASKLALIAVLAALDHRRRTGEGRFIELAQTEAAAFLAGELYLESPATGRAPEPSGNAVRHACPHGVYPCKGNDRWCAIAVVGEDAWRRFRDCLGWPAERHLARLAGRLAARAEIDARVARWTRDRSPEDVATHLQSAGVSAMPVLGPLELLADPHLAARRAFVALDDPEVGRTHHCANPIRMSLTPLHETGRAPKLGEHTEAALERLLGLDRKTLRELARAGVTR